MGHSQRLKLPPDLRTDFWIMERDPKRVPKISEVSRASSSRYMRFLGQIHPQMVELLQVRATIEGGAVGTLNGLFELREMGHEDKAYIWD